MKVLLVDDEELQLIRLEGAVKKRCPTKAKFCDTRIPYLPLKKSMIGRFLKGESGEIPFSRLKSAYNLTFQNGAKGC